MTSPHASLKAVPGLRLDDIVIETQPRKRLTGIDDLAESIRKHGLLQPLVVRDGNVLLFGHRRLAALKKLGWQSAPIMHIGFDVSVLEIAKTQRRETTEQVDLLPSEICVLAREVAGIEQARNPTGRTEPVKRRADGRRRSEFTENREAVAKALGIGHTKLSQINMVFTAGEAGDKAARKALDEMDKTGAVNGPYVRYKALRDRRPKPLTVVPEPKPEPVPVLVEQPIEVAEEPSRIGWRKRDHHKVVGISVSTLTAAAKVLSGIADIDQSISREEAARWAGDLTRSLATIRAFRTRLKDYSHGSNNDT